MMHPQGGAPDQLGWSLWEKGTLYHQSKYGLPILIWYAHLSPSGRSHMTK